MKIIERARQFAIKAHDSIGHKRKYTDEPYHLHPERVVQILQTVVDDEEVLAAAWLHDVLEDVAPMNADFNEQAIEQMFGERVLTLVLEVTDVSKPTDGNRETRKAINREHLAKASYEGKTIKLADVIDNMIDITKNDPHFSKIFRKEILLDLPYLRQGNKILYERLIEILAIE